MSVVAGVGTPVPGSTLDFVDFGSFPSISGGSVAFRGVSQFGAVQGVYAEIGGALVRIADSSSGGGIFMNQVSISGTDVAFVIENPIPSRSVQARIGGAGQMGIYTDLGGSLEKVVDIGDTLDGKQIVNVTIGTEGLSGSRIVVRVAFSDGSQGIYLGRSIPAPPADRVIAAHRAPSSARTASTS